MLRPHRPAQLVALLALAAFAGCKDTYYSAWQKLGYEKRDILVSRVKDARDDEDKAKQQFQTTLQQFQAVTNFNGGDLEAEYKKLNSQYESCVSRADDVHTRIQKVESVAGDMFDEWQQEIGQYSNEQLKQSSRQKLEETKARYQKLIGLMKNSEAKMQPVLSAFHDQVLYLKHNLNAAAIASLQTTAAGIDTNVNQLVADMNASIAEANDFIAKMDQTQKTGG